ncbi:major capsid protein [Ferrovibrio xuzhouensis]|uniref:Major capsid protein n=1 Tax=Ferrovibrio xuzhouensis TaxID=1576914 RepID=A0ABV7VBY1_9PROT
MDYFNTTFLTRVVQALYDPSTFLLRTYFPFVQTNPDKEEIAFDIDQSKPRITPFVHPTVAGKVVKHEGFETMTFKPAYVKDKREFNTRMALKRVMGEQIAGNLTPEQRREMLIAQTLDDQLRMLTRRETVMASEVLRLGQVTVSGDGYPAKVLDFKRDAGLTIALGAGSKWGDAGISPVDNLETWASLILDKSGTAARVVTMDPKAYALARADDKFQRMLDRDAYRGQTQLVDGPVTRARGEAAARFVGMLGDLEIWVYNEPYIDDAGAQQNVLPDFTVIMGATGADGSGAGGLEGTRAYGAIMDEEAAFKADRYFVKSWLENDPSVRWILLQSAPLVFPYRPNASICVTVK